MNSLFKMDFSLQHCSAILSGEAPLTEVSFAVEAAVSHFIGRKVNRFECKRSKIASGNCHLDFSALKLSGPMAVSKVMTVQSAADVGVIPFAIGDTDNFLAEDAFPKVTDGQHRHGCFSKLENNLVSTVIETKISSGSSLSLVSYGLADMFTGLFALNVSHIKWQISLQKTQLFFKHNLSDKQINDYFASKIDYDTTRKIKTLN